MVTIHIDYVDGSELSYIEGLEKIDNNPDADFTTNVTTFFSNSFDTNVIVIDKHGKTINKYELMSNKGFKYTDREMRLGHNINKMLIANSFAWKQSTKEFYIYNKLLNYDEDKLFNFFTEESKLGHYSYEDKILKLNHDDIVTLLTGYEQIHLAKMISVDVLDAIHIAYRNKAIITFNNIRNVKIQA